MNYPEIDKGKIITILHNSKQKKEDCHLLIIIKKGRIKRIIKKIIMEEVENDDRQPRP